MVEAKKKLAKMTPEQRKKYELLKEKKKQLEHLKKRLLKQKMDKQNADNLIRKYEESNKLLFFGHPGKGHLGKYGKWEPTRPQNLALKEFTNPIRETILYEGGNRGGKTFLLTCLSLAALKGYFPWEPKENQGWLWKLFGWKPPISIRIVGQDWKKHIAGVLVPRMDELIPDSWGLEASKMGELATSQYYDPEFHGKISIVSNNSESSDLEGWEGHFCCYDEPPTRENRVACARGLADHNGKEFFSMTLLKEPWIENEVMNAVDEEGNADLGVYTVHTTIYDNKGHGLNQAGIDSFSKKLTEEEKKVRLLGESVFKAGKILNIDKAKHVMDATPEDIRPHWLIDVQVDYHPSKPQFILFLATDESNFKYVCHTIMGHGDGLWIADQIVKARNRYCMRIEAVYADPLSKSGGLNFAETEYDKMERGLAKFNLPLYSAGKLKASKEDGIIRVNSMLNTLNKMVQLKFFKTCGYAIKQCMGWMNDDQGKPSKVDDDYPECLYRACLLDTEYYPPRGKMEDEEDRSPRLARNRVTGY